jgi:heterodisulfide reductase subunit B
MQSYLYFPGCTLRTVAKDFDVSAKASARALGFELREMQGWLCCGAVFTNSAENLITQSGPNRILGRAQAEGDTLVTLCAGCFNVLRRTTQQAKHNQTKQDQINAFNEDRYTGGVNVIHLLEILRDKVGFDKIKQAVKMPLQGVPVAAYYGCLLLRPFREMKLDDPHRPSIIEKLLGSLGATVIDYPSRTECCGSYLGVESPEKIEAVSSGIVESARSSGAKILAVSCPLCKYNLEVCQGKGSSASSENEPLPVVYFTQLLGLALGLPPDQLELNSEQLRAIRGCVMTPVESVSRQ